MRTLLHLLQPLSLAWLLLGVAVVVQWRAKQRRAAFWASAAWVVFSLVACFDIGPVLLASLERPWLTVKRESLPAADAMLVLGGGMSAAPERAVGVDFLNESDRVITGIDLVRQGKAPVLLISGGRLPVNHGQTSEAEATRLWIERWKLVGVPVLSLGVCAHTRDEAVKMKALADERGWRRILLVTTASHLKRAQAAFEATGLEIIAVPGSWETRIADGLEPELAPHLPSSDGLHAFDYWMHEVIGWWVYRARGWL